MFDDDQPTKQGSRKQVHVPTLCSADKNQFICCAATVLMLPVKCSSEGSVVHLRYKAKAWNPVPFS